MPADEASFWALAAPVTGTSCWLWHGRASPDEKGHLLARVTWQARQWLAHRLEWQLSGHALPPGQKLLPCPSSHLCINPKHLQLSRGVAKAYLQGERASSAKLTERQVRWLRREHAAGRLTCAEAARRLGLSYSSVRDILQRRNWKHLLD